MDDFESFAANEDDASTSQSAAQNRPNGHVRSGITLVLPSLKAIKAGKMGKKSKLKHLAFSQDAEVKKAPRPMKLKPLKEVLTKLITQLKK
jgi:bromodomain-containing protein 7/9